MRLDHIAYRVKDRYKTAQFFEDTMGYKIATEFDIVFEDNTTADCLALIPTEKRYEDTTKWISKSLGNMHPLDEGFRYTETHAPPEIFISDGKIGSIVGDWVEERNGVGGVHHFAY